MKQLPQGVRRVAAGEQHDTIKDLLNSCVFFNRLFGCVFFCFVQWSLCRSGNNRTYRDLQSSPACLGAPLGSPCRPAHEIELFFSAVYSARGSWHMSMWPRAYFELSVDY